MSGTPPYAGPKGQRASKSDDDTTKHQAHGAVAGTGTGEHIDTPGDEPESAADHDQRGDGIVRRAVKFAQKLQAGFWALEAKDRWTVTAAWAAACVALLYTIVATAQWFELKATNRQAENAMVNAQRAWILVDDIPMKSGSGSDKGYGSMVGVNGAFLHAKLTNFGGGPATDTVMTFRMQCTDRKSKCPDPVTVTPDRASHSILGPRHSVYVDKMFAFGKSDGDDEWRRIGGNCQYADILGELPARILWLLGRIDYVDQFGQKHCTLACFQYGAARGDWWDYAEEHNEIDDRRCDSTTPPR